MANIPYGVPTTLANYVAGDALAKEIKWSAGAELSGRQKNWASSFVEELGNTENGKMPIWLKQDASSIKRGNQIHFSVTAPLGGATVRGGTTKIEGKEEKERNSGFDVKVGVQRWVTGSDYEARAFTHIGSDFDNRARTKLGELAGYNQGNDIGMRYKLSAVPGNTLYAGGVTSRAKLTPNDTLSVEMIEIGRSVLSNIGGRPTHIVKGKMGQVFDNYLSVFTDLARTDLTQSNNYYDAVKLACDRGGDNPLFTGQLVDLSGNPLYSYSATELDVAGPVGSWQQPEALLGVAITQATTTFAIQGGAGLTYNTDNPPLFFWDFPNYAYPFNDFDVYTPASTAEYFVVYDLADRKWCLYSYTTGNIGYQITIVNRLAASASGAAVATLGGVAWDGTRMKEAFPVGSLILPVSINVDDAANPLVVYVGITLMTGAGSMYIGYGDMRMERFAYEDNGGLDKFIGAMSVTGCNVFTRTDGLPNQYIIIYHAINKPGVDLSLV